MPISFLIKTGIEVLLLGFIAYWLIQLARETRALRILRGLVIIGIIWLVTVHLELGALKVIFTGVDMATVLVIALLVLFTPEIKEALARLGGRGRREEMLEDQTVEDIVNACAEMAKTCTGALIVLQRNDGLGDITGTGVPMDAHITQTFIEQVFYPKSPLHDGALIVSGQRAVAARCTLPMSASDRLGGHLGMRHKAGVGLAEVRDAITIIVSEERGSISYCERGNLVQSTSIDQLRKLLREAYSRELRESRNFNPWHILTHDFRYKMTSLAIGFSLWCLNTQTVYTTYDFELADPLLPRDYVNLVEWERPDSGVPLPLQINNAVVRGRNFNLIRFWLAQSVDSSTLARQFQLELTREQIESEQMALCPVTDPHGNLQLLDHGLEGLTPYVAQLELQLLEAYRASLLEPKAPDPFKDKDMVLEFDDVLLRCYKGNLAQLKSVLERPLAILPRLEVEDLLNPIEGREVEVLLPGYNVGPDGEIVATNDPEVPEELVRLFEDLYGRKTFKAKLYYAPAGSYPRLAQSTRLRGEVRERRARLRDVKTRLEATLTELRQKRDPSEREIASLESHAQAVTAHSTARERLELTNTNRNTAYQNLADAQEALSALDTGAPPEQVAAAELDLKVARQIAASFDQLQEYDQKLAELRKSVLDAYASRLRPVFDLQSEITRLKTTRTELESNGTSTPPRFDPRPYREHADFLKDRLLTSDVFKAEFIDDTVLTMLEPDPLETDLQPRALAHQTAILKLLVDVKEYRNTIAQLWDQEIELPNSNFPDLAQARLERDRQRAKILGLRASSTLRQLEAERTNFLQLLNELGPQRLSDQRRQLLQNFSQLVSMAPEDDRTMKELLRSFPPKKRSDLLRNVLEPAITKIDQRIRDLQENASQIPTRLEDLAARQREIGAKRLHWIDRLRNTNDISGSERRLILRQFGTDLPAVNRESELARGSDLEVEARLIEKLREAIAPGDPNRASLAQLFFELHNVLQAHRKLLGDLQDFLEKLDAILSHTEKTTQK